MFEHFITITRFGILVSCTRPLHSTIPYLKMKNSAQSRSLLINLTTQIANPTNNQLIHLGNFMTSSPLSMPVKCVYTFVEKNEIISSNAVNGRNNTLKLIKSILVNGYDELYREVPHLR
jgi:hypothetical protein